MNDHRPLPREMTVVWARTDDPCRPFTAKVNGQRWTIYLGEFPEEPLYTLLIDGAEIESFDSWPPAWGSGF